MRILTTTVCLIFILLSGCSTTLKVADISQPMYLGEKYDDGNKINTSATKSESKLNAGAINAFVGYPMIFLPFSFKRSDGENINEKSLEILSNDDNKFIGNIIVNATAYNGWIGSHASISIEGDLLNNTIANEEVK